MATALAEPGIAAVNILLAAAEEFAHEGFRVLPLRPGGKEPLTRRGVRDATTNPEIIRRWWARWPQANIGVAIPEGFVVLDVDGPTGRASVAGHHLPETATAQTGRGWHYWYRLPPNVTGRNRTGLLNGVDVKAAGGYVVAPPSLHETGRVYRWAEGRGPREIKVAMAPTWVLHELTAAPTAPPEVGGVDNGGGAAAPPRAPLTMNDVILAAAGRGPRW